MNSSVKTRWDIFCAVVDNFGDIGICWRLSRQLVAEHALQVRLWVDDLASFQRICPAIKPDVAVQWQAGVEICHWQHTTDWQRVCPAKVVIEALACTIPFAYQQQMAQAHDKPLWINLEYLSAETWIDECHGLASPQPQLPLTKYFFFPGFTVQSGGLLCEQGLIEKLTLFQNDSAAQQRFWQGLGIVLPLADYLKVSLFAYSHQHLASLFECWQKQAQPVLCVIPAGTLAEQAKQLLAGLSEHQPWQGGALTVQLLPFLPQPDYDYLLSACDVNFVRGEDSVIRAQWAAKPFIWQIYRQAEHAHLLKLQAFYGRYTARWDETLAKPLHDFQLAWNTEQDLTASWQTLLPKLTEIEQKNLLWRNKLQSLGDLASNLVRFVEKKIII